VKSSGAARDIAAATAAHVRLLTDLDGLTDVEAWQPSLLPRWTVGHVLTHIARNADGLARMMRAAERGEVGDQYVGGVISRAADIDAGADRPAIALVEDVRMSTFHLEQSWDELTDIGWAGTGQTVRGEMPITALPFRRLTEVEVHHADLGLGYTAEDWPDAFVRPELARLTGIWKSRQPMGLTELPRDALALTPNQRLAWLMGRRDIDGVAAADIIN
jgi:maleylpyruvate isomerase